MVRLTTGAIGWTKIIPPCLQTLLPDEFTAAEALFAKTAHAMGDAPREVKVFHIGNCLKADPVFGKGIDAMGTRRNELLKNKNQERIVLWERMVVIFVV
jgi:hypothetical protein